jgi:hypothetical protein
VSEHAFASIPRPNQIEHDRVLLDIVVTRARIRQEFVDDATPAKGRGEQFVGNERDRKVALAVMYLIDHAATPVNRTLQLFAVPVGDVPVL